MLYVPFIQELVAKLPGVNFCMETSGYASKSAFAKVMPLIDLFLFDYKVTDPLLHKEFCGFDNALILENLDYLYESGKKIILRLPLIPTLNDTADHFDGIAGILKRYPNILRAEIMPYHVFGLGKSEELGEGVSPLLPKIGASELQVKTWLEELQSRGCTNVYRS
jgi:pyruvate formate lyase activating enzyme